MIARLALVIAIAFVARATAAEIKFTPKKGEFAAAAEEYRSIWKVEGERITEALQRASGLHVEATTIQAIVLEAPSFSGYRDRPMRLRASYTADMKRATLVHELS